MKNKYVKPVMEIEVFKAGNYCASTCGETERVYKFVCDAGTSEANVWAIRDASGQTLTNKETWTFVNYKYGIPSQAVTYHACGETHLAPTQNEFITGLHLDRKDTVADEQIPVVIWRGTDGVSLHCTTKLSKDEWEIVKS